MSPPPLCALPTTGRPCCPSCTWMRTTPARSWATGTHGTGSRTRQVSCPPPTTGGCPPRPLRSGAQRGPQRSPQGLPPLLTCPWWLPLPLRWPTRLLSPPLSCLGSPRPTSSCLLHHPTPGSFPFFRWTGFPSSSRLFPLFHQPEALSPWPPFLGPLLCCCC